MPADIYATWRGAGVVAVAATATNRAILSPRHSAMLTEANKAY